MVNVADTDDALPSRRDAGKAKTRQALIEAALTLFATNGYDQTTAEAIAERAGVSARTFFRHFATKESVLFFGEDDFYRLFIDELGSQPASLPELSAISTSFVSVTPAIQGIRDRFKQYREATASSSALRGQEVTQRQRHVDDVAKAIARRRGLRRADNSCRVVAVVVTSVFELATADWVSSSGNMKLATIVAERFRLLSEIASTSRRR